MRPVVFVAAVAAVACVSGAAEAAGKRVTVSGCTNYYPPVCIVTQSRGGAYALFDEKNGIPMGRYVVATGTTGGPSCPGATRLQVTSFKVTNKKC